MAALADGAYHVDCTKWLSVRIANERGVDFEWKYCRCHGLSPFVPATSQEILADLGKAVRRNASGSHADPIVLYDPGSQDEHLARASSGRDAAHTRGSVTRSQASSAQPRAFDDCGAASVSESGTESEALASDTGVSPKRARLQRRRFRPTAVARLAAQYEGVPVPHQDPDSDPEGQGRRRVIGPSRRPRAQPVCQFADDMAECSDGGTETTQDASDDDTDGELPFLHPAIARPLLRRRNAIFQV